MSFNERYKIRINFFLLKNFKNSTLKSQLVKTLETILVKK